MASTSEEAIQWVRGFADQQCFVNCLPHPLIHSKKYPSDLLNSDFSLESRIKCKSPPTMLVILNPRSGSGRSSKVFHGMVEPIFKVRMVTWNLITYCQFGYPLSISELLLGATINKRTCQVAV